MTATTRRLWFYGLLLLLPALAVGGLALGLLAREQARLAEREQAARESRRAAVETRARLIAENIELLVGDVQSALMETLREAPAAEPRAFLVEWRANNPLVRDVFRATAEGGLVWGATGDSLRDWLARSPPWRDAPTSPVAAPAPLESAVAAKDQDERVRSASASQALEAARRDISSNVGQYQRARQEIQEIAKLKGAASPAPQELSEERLVLAERKRETEALFAAAPTVSAAPSLGASVMLATKASVGDVASANGLFAETPVSMDDAILRSGWTPWRDAAGLHLVGWRELPDRTVVGLELRLDAIKARLGEVFPATPEPGEAYALHDATGFSWHRAGDSSLPVALEVPLDAAALPGWVVAGGFAAADYASSSGGFFGLGAVLVGLLVLAILAAGALLVRQARLSEAEAAQKTSFVANVSHELKTPLTTIRLYAELLAQGRVREEARRADYLATIGRETERLARLVGNVLDFSRLEQGRKKYDRASFDLAAELRRLAETHGPRLAEAGLVLRVEAPSACPVATDRDSVEQIVLNLFDNACKYAADGGEAILALECGPDGARVSLADRGPGVPADQRERIFEKFHRVDDRLTAERAGAGLGLSIARRLARGLGGDLRCAPREGGGARFVFTLPAVFSP